MNTTLKIIALVLTAAVPVAFGAESLGVALPTAINTAHLFGGFVVSLMALMVLTDYRTAKPLRMPTRAAKSPLQLAA